MKVVTEAYLRSRFRNQGKARHGDGTPVRDRFVLEPGQILTPSGRAFLSDQRIPVQAPDTGGSQDRKPAQDPENRGKGAGPGNRVAQDRDTAPTPAGRYVSALDGGRFETKPEFMTHLKGNQLVAKDHGRIIFRGRLDSFQSAILMIQAQALEQNRILMAEALEEILDWVRQMVKAEVLDTPLEKSTVLGLTPDELRQHSHNPKKAYGVDHITPSAAMGTALVGLNFLRSLVREVETAGVAAFRREFEVQRPDILTALNRMSSALYIMMARERAGMYGPGKKNGTVSGQDPVKKERHA